MSTAQRESEIDIETTPAPTPPCSTPVLHGTPTAWLAQAWCHATHQAPHAKSCPQPRLRTEHAA